MSKSYKSSGRQYKNVYTILEKVKKGEIKSYYSEKEGLFGKLNFYKKPDLIKPHMHWLDENRLESIMSKHLDEMSTYVESMNKYGNSAEYKKVNPDAPFDKTAFIEACKDIYRNVFPKHILRDVFKMFYHKMNRLEFEERSDKNTAKFKFLEQANNPVGKIMSESSNLKSAIFARNVVAAYIMRLAALKMSNIKDFDNIKKALNEQGSEFDQKEIEKALSTMMDNTVAKNLLEKAMNDATELCKTMDTVMDKDTQEMMYDQIKESSNGEASKLNMEFVKNISARLENIKLSMGSLKEKIKKLLDKSTSYFSSNVKTEYDDLLNSDDIASLNDYELLNPKIRKLFVEDILIKHEKKVGKIDLYIDISGSMSSSCGVKNSAGQVISKIDFCKSFAVKLLEMNMLNDIYLFDTKVKKYKKDLISISLIHENGGTTINNAVQSIITNQNNALVITDAEDNCNVYSPNAFFIGVQGANFHGFRNEVLQKYLERDQLIVFNGEQITKIDSEGYPIV